MLDKEETVEKKKIGIGAMTVITIVTILIVVLGIVAVLRIIGKNNLTTSIVDAAETIDIGKADETLEDNQILYNGKVYELNEELITILVMGMIRRQLLRLAVKVGQKKRLVSTPGDRQMPCFL